MDRERQIEEMFNDLCEADKEFYRFCRGKRCQECEYYCPNCYPKKDCKNKIFAERLTEKGYRKVDSITFMGGIVEQLRAEVAEEIFAEIEKICGTNGFHFICTVEKFKELKKKYESEKDDGKI